MRCCMCGKESDKVINACGRIFCMECMHGGSEPLMVHPIGYVKNSLKREPGKFCVKGDKNAVSRIELFPAQKMFMHGIGDEKHLTVLYWLHESREPREKFSRGLDGKEVGVFASRTPDRLSRIAVSEVMLEKAEGTTLFVRGLDAVDGSPVLDIKLGRKAIGF